MADGKVNKVVYDGETLIDLTEDTVTEDALAKGATAHNAQGLAIEGAFEDAIQHIKVNGEERPVEDFTVDIEVPTKVSELDNDVPYGTKEEVEAAQSAADDARLAADNAYNAAEKAQSEAESAQSAAASAQTSADGAQKTADEALTNAGIAQDSADSKVASVTVGSIESGDTPDVKNSGSEKEVVLDFTFPETGGGMEASYDEPTETVKFEGGGGSSGAGGQASNVVTGTLEDDGFLELECTFAQLTYGGANTNFMGLAIYSAGTIKNVSSANGFDVYKNSNGVTLENFCGAVAYYTAIIIK